jgi:phenylpropionate dioxygenase-like ring-hydroxylating dioxygenase large terminal subunit
VSRSRFPFTSLPTGWYAVAFSDELPVAGVRPRHCFDQDLVLYRTATGAARLADAFCPHMGAHLGHGGLVEGELLRCTFHGFCFDGRGACARTPYGTLPSATVRLVQWEVRERHGLVLAWYDAARRPPLWEIPDLDSSGWLAAATGRLEVDSHPQETTENSVDLGHFTALHSFESSRVTREMTTEGPRLEISYQAVRELALRRGGGAEVVERGALRRGAGEEVVERGALTRGAPTVRPALVEGLLVSVRDA